jgi:hypothetical protein
LASSAMNERGSSSSKAAFRLAALDRVNEMSRYFERDMLRARRLEVALRMLQLVGLSIIAPLILMVPSPTWEIKIAAGLSVISVIAATASAAFRFDERWRTARAAVKQLLNLKIELEVEAEDESEFDFSKRVKRTFDEINIIQSFYSDF